MTINYLDSKRLQGLSTDIVETPTQSFDFSSSTGWTQTGSNINISGGKLNWIGDRTVSNNAISYDLGSSANANSWVLDFNITLTNYSAGSATYTHRLGIMLSSLGSSSSSNIQRQFIGCDLTWRTDESSTYRRFYAKDDNNNTQKWGDNAPANTPDDSTAHNFPVQGQTYNIKIIKLTSTTYKVEIINTANSAIFDTLTGICSSTGLQHILIQNYSDDTDGNPAFDGTIDDMKFYNGVSSLTSKPTNVQTNSIFEQTDTNTRHWYDGTNWNTGGHDKAISTYSPTFFLKLNEGTGTALTNSGTNSGYTASITNTDNYLSWVTGKTKQNALQMKPHPNNRINHTALPTNLASGYNFTMMLTVKFSAMNTDHFNIWTWANPAVGMYPILIKDKKLTSGYYNGAWYYIQDPNTFDNDVWYTFGVTQQYTSGQSGTIKVYKDGVLVASGTATDSYGFTDNVESLGITTTADANKSMTVDGVFFKNSVLTPTEMLDLHKRMYY